MNDHGIEVATGGRFEFGRTWLQFLSVLNDRRIEEAENSIRRLLEGEPLGGRTFIDVGCGSGIFSLGARRLRMRVVSFDYDPAAVACTEEVRQRYSPEDMC